MKIQNKITLLFTLLTGMVILLFCVFIYLFASRNIHESFYHRLEVRSEIAGHTELQENINKSEIYNEVKNKYLKNLPAENHRKFEQANNDGIIKEAIAAGLPPDFIKEAISQGKSRFFNTDTFYVATYISRGSEKILVVSSAVDEAGYEELESLKKIIFIGFGVSILVVFYLGKLFASAVFKPVREIVKKVNIIKASNLHLRLEEKDGKDEISDLTFTFNKMLTRLETTFELQNNFVSNASHELKTPLTVISGEAELALRKANDEPVKFALEKIIAESERLEHLMNSLLSLAQTGFDGKKPLLEIIRIDELILNVKIAANKIFPNNKIEIDYDHLPDDGEKLYLRGNPVTLKVALLNIFINACKYSGNQKVKADIITDKQNIIVTIRDTGIGIPEEELSQIFVPFFRASNTTNFKGYGIGLPLAMNIIKMHEGRIEAKSAVNQGTMVKVFLPLLK